MSAKSQALQFPAPFFQHLRLDVACWSHNSYKIPRTQSRRLNKGCCHLRSSGSQLLAQSQTSLTTERSSRTEFRISKQNYPLRKYKRTDKPFVTTSADQRPPLRPLC